MIAPSGGSSPLCSDSDTPMPPDEPRGEDPPDGAIIDYFLKAGPAVAIEILDGGGKMGRRFSSRDRTGPLNDHGDVPRRRVRPRPLARPRTRPGRRTSQGARTRPTARSSTTSSRPAPT